MLDLFGFLLVISWFYFMCTGIIRCTKDNLNQCSPAGDTQTQPAWRRPEPRPHRTCAYGKRAPAQQRFQETKTSARTAREALGLREGLGGPAAWAYTRLEVARCGPVGLGPPGYGPCGHGDTGCGPGASRGPRRTSGPEPAWWFAGGGGLRGLQRDLRQREILGCAMGARDAGGVANSQFSAPPGSSRRPAAQDCSRCRTCFRICTMAGR